jgi:tetratricopeptide (TPR) repeat protein
MKSLALSAIVASAIVPLAAANGAVMTLGGALSHLCYQSALAADGRSFAVEGCTRALTEESLARPDRAATFVNRGILLMSGSRFADADADFDSALRLDRNLPDAWLNKGFVRLRQGNGREALALIQKGIDAGASRQALAFFARGVAYEQMGQFRSAYADLRRAQRLAPDWTMPREYLSRYRVQGR